MLNGVNRSITYTSYSKPLTITIPKATTSFYYNADRQKFARFDYIDETPSDCKRDWLYKCRKNKTALTYYLDDYELVTIDGGRTIQQKSYIGPSTIHIKTKNKHDSKKNGIEIYEMLHNNLGSVTDITDASGNVIQHFSYTPFGEQKQTKGGIKSYPITHKGFTGHETIEKVNLIHMGGRIYDPVIGRFLSADPYIQDPANSQSLNRYSYCINNPLAFIDPSGFGFFSDLWRGVKKVFNSTIGRIAVGVVLAVVSYFIPPLAPIAGAWWKAAIIGGAITTGLGLAAGVGWKQALLEGAGAFAITAGGLYAYGAISGGGALPITISGKSGAGIVGGIGIPLGSDGPENNPSPTPGSDFPGSNLPNQTNDALPESNFDHSNSLPSRMSDRTGRSPVGNTEASLYNGGNNSNGASSNAYSWCHEKARWAELSGRYSKELILVDQSLCERGKQISLMTALALTGGTGRLGAVSKTDKGSTSSLASKAMQWTRNFLGKNPHVITNKAGDKIFINKGNTRRIRFDIKNTHEKNGKPHAHIETKQGNRWKDYTNKHRIYFNGE